MLYASQMEWSKIVAEYAKEAKCVKESIVWGQGWKTSAQYAALVNGTCAHGIEMDDRSLNLSIHCGAAVIPTAIALWEKTKTNGKELIASIVAGYEMGYRLAAALEGSCRHRFYGSPIKSLFGATVTAGKLLGLKSEKMQNAMGIAGSMASGLREWSEDPKGTMIKRLSGGGWPAQNGVTAALLAQKGLTGPATILEGERGVCRAFAIEEKPRIEKLTESLGKKYWIMERCIKLYGACGLLQADVDCLNEMKSTHKVKPKEIERISLGCSFKTFDMHNSKQPQSIMAAQYSLPFVTALGFLTDLTDPSVWNEKALKRADVKELMQKIDMYMDDELERIYRETGDDGGTKMTVKLKDGRELKNWYRYSKGTLEYPATPEDIHHKFDVMAGHIFSKKRVREISDLVQRLEELKTPVSLSKALM